MAEGAHAHDVLCVRPKVMDGQRAYTRKDALFVCARRSRTTEGAHAHDVLFVCARMESNH